MNWQNIPRDLKVVKRAVVPKRGALSFFDYSQIEPRYFGYFVATGLKDPTIADWYREGRDVYREIAGRVFGREAEAISDEERQDGKVWFLMSLYSAGPKKIAAETGMSYKDALAFYKQFHAGLPWIKQLSNPRPKPGSRAEHFWEPGLVERIYSKRGYLKTPHGRHLHAEQFGEHKLLNKLIQGSAADLMKAALVRVDEWLGYRPDLESRMVSVIHDEIIFDGPEHELPVLHEHVPELMREDFLTAVIPIDVDHEVSTTNWAEKIGYEEWLAGQ